MKSQMPGARAFIQGIDSTMENLKYNLQYSNNGDNN